MMALDAVPDLQSEVDTLVVDREDQAVAARIIHRGIVTKSIHGIKVTGEAVEWPEHIMAWLSKDSDKISRIETLIDTQNQAATSLPRTPADLTQRPPPEGFSLDATYRSYMSALNGSQLRLDMPKYFHPQIIHTAKEWAIGDLIAFLETSPTLFDGLRLSVADLLVDTEGHQVAARIKFEGVPVKPFFGLGPPKERKKICFFEHAFYKLDGDKFKFIWAMLDIVSFKKQVES